MVPLPTIPAIPLPPITWTGICVGVIFTVLVATATTIYFMSKSDKEKAPDNLPSFEEIATVDLTDLSSSDARSVEPE